MGITNPDGKFYRPTATRFVVIIIFRKIFLRKCFVPLDFHNMNHTLQQVGNPYIRGIGRNKNHKHKEVVLGNMNHTQGMVLHPHYSLKGVGEMLMLRNTVDMMFEGILSYLSKGCYTWIVRHS